MSNSDVCVLVVIILMLAGIFGFYILVLRNRKQNKKTSILSQTSYHNFAKFLDENNITFDDEHFEKNYLKLKCLLVKEKEILKKLHKN